MDYSVLVEPGKTIDLSKISPGEHGGFEKQQAEWMTHQLGEEMAELQELLFAAGQHSLLVVLQGLDTAGKDGSIRKMLNFVNVQSTKVYPFKVPTPAEMGHDFLWRVHSRTPGKGEISIFNRSHYEDVLVVRVHDLVPKEVWKERYNHINNFEKLLADANTIILKFMLHISKDEQAERLKAREEEPGKGWKLSVGDWKERELWDEYQRAYEDALNNCSTKHAPWRVVPADHKWFRDLAISEAIVETLRPYKDGWTERLTEIGDQAKAELAEYRATKKSQ